MTTSSRLEEDDGGGGESAGQGITDRDHSVVTPPDFLRSSRDGDQFHYTWAARQALRLLDVGSGLAAIYVEAVDPSEHVIPFTFSTDDDSTDDGEQPQGEDGLDPDAGDEVIDLAEYWGSSDIDEAKRVVYRQFKHSTTHPDAPWTFSFFTKTLVGFARKYRSLLADHPAAISGVSFEFITNRPAAQSALTVLGELREDKTSTAATAARDKLAGIISGDQIGDFARRVEVDLPAPSLLKLRSLLETQVADLLPGVPGDQALLMREMISSRATSIVGHQPAVRREDVLAALKTSEDQLAPAPNLIEMPSGSVVRRQFTDIAERIRSAQGAPVVIHGPGGVGKSVLSMALLDDTPPGSVTLVFDCYGNGSYRRPSAARHRPKQGLVQLANELAMRALCDPLVPSSTADDSDYARALLNRISNAATAIAAVTPGALLTLVIDAADNAAMIARDNGDRSFVTGLIREEFPANVRLVVTCRTERRHLLALPAGHVDLPLRGFDLAETRAHMAQHFSAVADADVAEFHNRTSHNPRVQATVLDATATIREALDWLAPRPVSADVALDAIIERQVAAVRDSQHSSVGEIDQICIGLAALRPMIPARVLAELADVEESVVLSFVADLGRPLLIDGGTVQFRDEPTETWFRDNYRPSGKALDDFLACLSPLADRDAYVAASLPALLFEAHRFEDLVRLALSDEALPDNALPPVERNELQRREIAQQRTHFALTAALREDRDLAAAQLALRLGALTAGRTRRLILIHDNTDLAAQFLDAHLLEQLVATRSVASDWPNSNLLYEGALLAGAAGQTDQARNRLRSAVTWVRAWTRQAANDKTRSEVTENDILQIAWGLLNTDGPGACIEYLRAWRPRTLAYDVGVVVARRLADAGRNADLEALALRTRGRQTKFALAQVYAERNLPVHADVVTHLLQSTLRADKRLRPGRRDDEPWASPINEQAHLGLTAVSWLLTQALANQTVSREEALRVLNLYLPDNMGHRTGELHQRDLWQPLLGFALRAWLEGRELTATEIEGPTVAKAREREHIESSRTLRSYRANVEPLVSWANLWTVLQLDPTPERLLDFAAKAKAFLGQPRHRVHRDEQTDNPQLNITATVIVSVLAQNPSALAHNEVTKFCERNRGSLWRSTLIQLTQQAAASEPLRPMVAELARQVHSDVVTAREDAQEKANHLVQLARATYQTSPREAEVHFQAALDTANAIGDDAWTRWETLLTVARLVGETSGAEPGRAYRLGQIAEGIESYLGDYFDHTQVMRAVAGLSLPEALALASRWRDRRVAPVTRLAEAFCIGAEPLLRLAPTTALMLLPLCDRPLDLKEVGEALSTSTEPAGPTVLALLHFLRSAPPTCSSVDELLDSVGLTRQRIADADPALLPHHVTSPDPAVTQQRTYVDDASRPSYEGLDLTTVDGWTEALARGHSQLDRDGLFTHVVDSGPSPEVIEAFEKCPTVDQWDLSALLDVMDTATLSMGTRAALDTALVTLLGRLAEAFLLVSYRSVDATRMRALTGRHTDYEHIASRALAEQVTFTADQSFALAGQLARRLDPTDRLRLFDAAAELFVETAPLDSGDGRHPTGMANTYDLETAAAALVWTALGDPSQATRWRATHAVHLMLALSKPELADRLCDIATGTVDVTPFRDQRLPFYERHATQWLLLALSRASLDEVAHANVARFTPMLRLVLDGDPHAVNGPLARDTMIRLCEAGVVAVDAHERRQLEAMGQPVGVVPPARGLRAAAVASFAEVLQLAETMNAARVSAEETATGGCDGREMDDEDDSTADASGGEGGSRDDRFHFFSDFSQYWCRRLGDAFQLTERSVEKLVEEVLINRWQTTTRGRPEDDPRNELRLYPQGTYAYKSDWPGEEDLDFYLAVQGLYEVAGTLLQFLPVSQTYDDDEGTGDTEYTRFLARHIPTRTDGRWLADRRDAPPQRVELLTDSGTASREPEDEWVFEISPDMFYGELRPHPDWVMVSSSRSVQDYRKRESVRVDSALVAPGTAHALRRALQTAPDPHAYRIPDATDYEYSSNVAGFELTGWIDPHGFTEGLDAQDPYAAGAHYPPQRPSTMMPGLDDLTPDKDMRLWRDQNGRVAFISRIWDESDGGTTSQGSSGYELMTERAGLGARLRRMGRWIIVEVEISRHLSESRTYAIPRNDDERPGYLLPYTKYFLIDFAGEVHDL